MKNGDAVLVTTKYRGVFFGYLDEFDSLPEEVSLIGARNVVYWSTEMRGFMGLLSAGPNSMCRIGPSSDITLWGITSVSPVSDEAVKRFEEGPWKS